MSDYIKREVALAVLESASALGMSFEDADIMIRNLPAADVAPIVHGQWETNSNTPDTLICSVCGCGLDMWKHDPHNYCPHCGARMDGEG